MRKLHLAVAMASAMALSTPASAGFFDFTLAPFIGASLGQTTTDSCITGTCDDSDTAWKSYGGLEMNEYISMEVGYDDLGTVDYSAPTGSRETNGMIMQMLGTYSLNPSFTLIGRGGMNILNTEVNGANAGPGGNVGDTDVSWSVGLGAQYNFTKSVGLRMEVSPLWGWWGQESPFAFGLDYAPAPGISRFLSGSQVMLGMLAMEASLDLTLEAAMKHIREKSVRMTEYLIELFDTFLAARGFRLGSPRDPERRGSHVSIRHPDGYRINRALTEEMNLIPDFREPDNIRLGLAPLYTSFLEVWEGVERIRKVVEEERYLYYSDQRQAVT